MHLDPERKTGTGIGIIPGPYTGTVEIDGRKVICIAGPELDVVPVGCRCLGVGVDVHGAVGIPGIDAVVVPGVGLQNTGRHRVAGLIPRISSPHGIAV